MNKREVGSRYEETAAAFLQKRDYTYWRKTSAVDRGRSTWCAEKEKNWYLQR